MDFGWLMKRGMIICGKMIILCNGNSGSLMVFGRVLGFDIMKFLKQVCVFQVGVGNCNLRFDLVGVGDFWLVGVNEQGWGVFDDYVFIDDDFFDIFYVWEFVYYVE